MITVTNRAPGSRYGFHLALALTMSLLLNACGSLSGSDSSARLAGLLATPERSESDRARDVGRKPAQVLSFLGVEANMTVMDLIASAGYYTEVLSYAVGPNGRVYAQNPPLVLRLRDGANDKAMKARLAGNRLPNVVRWDRDFQNMGLAEGSLDAALTALNFHDVYHRDEQNARAVLDIVHALLKPGGVLGVIDHVGIAGQDNAQLHRIIPAKIEALARAAGFVVEARSELLSNIADDHRGNVFTPELRGNTDRVLYRLRKPA